MANSCYTMYRFYGERAKELSDDLKKVRENHEHEYPSWCKHIATDILGCTEEQTQTMNLRGEFYIICDDATDGELLLDTDTAWCPCDELFYRLADKYELEIYYMADERGCVGIWSNDIDHKVWDWKYVIYGNGEEENFADEESAVEWINEELADDNLPPIKTFEDLENDVYEEHPFSITEVEYVNE